ncbi:MAG: DUF58 domain-containing protein [Lachnospiraceae bacterium]|nr:DUF58 domain-containing protein [Lachnospiraceae bacterium]
MILFLFAVILLAIFFQYSAQRRELKGLEASLSFSEALVEPDARFEIRVHLVNYSRAVFPFLRVSVHLPEEIIVEAPSGQLKPDGRGGQYLSVSAWLMPRQRLTRSLPVSIGRRGRFLTREMTVYCGDFLGLSEQGHSFSLFQEVVVMPRPAPRQDVEQVAGGPVGDISVNRFLFEDPVLTVGYRDYTGREPMKMLSWTQIARTGKLMVKQYDYTLETSVTVILNVECASAQAWTWTESAYSIARTVCEQLEEMGIQYSFRTNAVTAGDFSSWQSVGEGLGAHHLAHILEGLGRGLDQAAFSCETLLERTVRSCDSTRGLLFITPENDPQVLNLAARWADRAGVTLWTATGQEEPLC